MPEVAEYICGIPRETALAICRAAAARVPFKEICAEAWVEMNTIFQVLSPRVWVAVTDKQDLHDVRTALRLGVSHKRIAEKFDIPEFVVEHIRYRSERADGKRQRRAAS